MQYAIKINKIFWNLKNRILDTHMKHITLFYVINYIYMEFIFYISGTGSDCGVFFVAVIFTEFFKGES